MNNIMQDVHAWFGQHHPHASAAHAAAVTTTKENRMNVLDDLKGFIADVETIGADSIARVKRIAGNPLTAPALEWLDTLSGLNIDPQIITKTLGAIEAMHIAYTPPAPPAADATGQQQVISPAPAS